MNPSLAQGKNQSLLDVLALGQALDSNLKREKGKGAFVRAALEYQGLRFRKAMFYSRQSEMGSRLLVPRNSFYAWLAKRGMKKAAKNKRRRMIGMKINAGLLDSLSARDLLSLLL